ncbi:MAG: serine/threonine protein kinase, partial [Myxococcota bacterium]|nr:serine/threonine protein kinase [Myxococcota bacterium]
MAATPVIRGTLRALSDDADIRAQERVGTVLNDKWALERLLGVGGMAAVYAARHRNGARAAVKVLHADLSRRAEVRERFLREGYAANRVEHPGVVKVLDDDVVAAGPDAGTAYLVMELLDGESLQERLDRGPVMGEREFLTIAEEVLEVLEAAHARGVVHRDLKPENLFLVRAAGASEEEGHDFGIKVLDFGLARLLQEQTITSYGLALGTPSFMSPEQAAGRIDEIDGRTDLFAVAATGFRLRTGRRIHEGMNPVELVTKMANVAAPRIQSVVPDASDPFARVVDRALQFRREDRYANAAEMREDVGRAIAQLDARSTAAEVAVHALPLEGPPAEPTIQLGENDLERSESVPRRAPPSDASIAIPRRHAVLPWVALFAVGGIAGKFWIDLRHRVTAGYESDAPDASAVELPAGDASAAPSPLASDGAADAIVETATATSPPRSPPSVSPPPASTHRRTIPNVAPGTVHKPSGPRKKGGAFRRYRRDPAVGGR